MSKQEGFSLIGIVILLTIVLSSTFFIIKQTQETKQSDTEGSTKKIQVEVENANKHDVSKINIFSDSKNTFSFEYYGDYYTPVENIVIEDIRIEGQGRLKASTTNNYDLNSLSQCAYPQEVTTCLQKHWGHEGYVKDIELDGKPAKSFFINTKALDGITVLHVVQTEEPPMEFFMNVDGMGGEESFQYLLSTFKFSD
jgi:hypothetical protein